MSLQQTTTAPPMCASRWSEAFSLSEIANGPEAKGPKENARLFGEHQDRALVRFLNLET
jgi:hypothetical protein